MQKNTFNMRQITLQNLSATKNGVKLPSQNHRRSYSTTSVTKSLELLRVNLQNAINKDIDNVIRKYLDVSLQLVFSLLSFSTPCRGSFNQL